MFIFVARTMNKFLFDDDANFDFDNFRSFFHTFRKFSANVTTMFIVRDNVDTMNMQKRIEFFNDKFENLFAINARYENKSQKFIFSQKRFLFAQQTYRLCDDLTHALKNSLVKKFRVTKTNNFDEFIKNFEPTNDNLFFFYVNVNATRVLHFAYFNKNDENRHRDKRITQK